MGLSDLLFPTPQTEGGRIAQDAANVYAAYKVREALASRLSDRFFSSRDEDLRRANDSLDIRLKKKQLGLPYDSDDYEDAVNNDTGYFVRSTPAIGHAVTREIPDPSFLRPHTAPWFNLETSFQKTMAGGAEGAAGMLLSGGLRAGGGRYGRAAGAVARFFGRR